MKLDPAGRRRHGLSTIFGSPSFNEAQSDGAHSRQLIHGFEPLRHGLRQQRREFLIVEDLQVASGGDFADGRRMPAVSLITIGRLHEDGAVRETFGEHLAAEIIQPDASADVPSRHFHHRVPVDVGQQSQTIPFRVGRIRVSVDDERRLRSVEGLADASVEFVIRNGAPKRRLAVLNRLNVGVRRVSAGNGRRTPPLIEETVVIAAAAAT